MRTISEESGAPVVTADTFAAGLPDRFLRCRELGHVWRPFTASYDPKVRVYDRVLRCSSCRTTRHQVLDQRGHVLTNNYRHPADYLAKNVERGTYTRDVFRLEAVLRYLSHPAEKAS